MCVFQTDVLCSVLCGVVCGNQKDVLCGVFNLILNTRFSCCDDADTPIMFVYHIHKHARVRACGAGLLGCVCTCMYVKNSREKWRKCISVTGSLRGQACDL